MLPSQVPFWKNFPNACGRVEKNASKPFGRGISCINRHFQTFFLGVFKENDHFARTKNHVFHIELAQAVQNDTLTLNAFQK